MFPHSGEGESEELLVLHKPLIAHHQLQAAVKILLPQKEPQPLVEHVLHDNRGLFAIFSHSKVTFTNRISTILLTRLA